MSVCWLRFSVQRYFVAMKSLYCLLVCVLIGLCVTSLNAADLGGVMPKHVRVVWTKDPQHAAVVSWSTDEKSQTNGLLLGTEPHLTGVSAQETEVDGQFTGRGDEVFYFHHVRLSNLVANTTYYFSVQSGDQISRVYHFKTAPDTDAPFTLLVGGDSRTNRADRQKVNVLIKKTLTEQPQVLAFCHGGDYVTHGTNLKQWKHWLDDYEQTITDEGRVVPIMPTRGNHEKGGETYDQVFHSPGDGFGKNFFTTMLSPQVAVITLNTECSTAGRQRMFLEHQLKQLKTQQVRWQLTNYHRPAYPAIKKPSSAKVDWVPLFEHYNIDIAIESDGHCVKRTLPIRKDKPSDDGVVYVGEGGLGVKQRSPKLDRWFLQAPGKAGSEHHIQLMHFTAEKMTFQAVLLDGSIWDEHIFLPRVR